MSHSRDLHGKYFDDTFSAGGASLVVQMLKTLPPMQDTWVLSVGWEDPLKKEMAPTPIFLPRELHEQRSLVGNTVTKSEMTE